MAPANPFAKGYDFSKTITGKAMSGLSSMFSGLAKPYTGPGSIDPTTGGIKQTSPVAPITPGTSAPAFTSPPVTPQIKSAATASIPLAQIQNPMLPPTASPTPTPIATPVISATPAPANGPQGAQMPPVGNQGAPTLPTINPETQKAVTSAQQSYQDRLKVSPDELSTQEDIDKLLESTKIAYLNTEGKPIPMEFITGQLKAIQDRANGLAEPLNRKLARLQSARTASLESSKFALDRADKKLSEEGAGIQQAKTDAESARRFAIGEADKTAERTQSQTQFDANYKLSQDKFNEDKRQFGITAAQKNREIAVTEAKEAASKSGDTGKSEALDNYSLASAILDSGKINAITGWRSPLTALGITNQLQVNQVNQLKSTLSLANRQKLKGQGAVSDFEGKMLASAASSLDTNLSNADFTAQLKKIRGVFANAAGMATPVKVYDPKTRQAKEGSLDRAGIESAISQGYMVDYQ